MHVLIVEELPALRKHAQTIVASTLHIFDGMGEITAVANATDAIAAFEAERPQVVLMNTVVAGMSATRLAQHIWSKAPATKIIFWVNHHRDFQIRELQRVMPPPAIAGYVLQTSDDDKLSLAIESVVQFSNSWVDPELRAQMSGCEQIPLTDLEQETLGDLLLGLTDKAIARKRSLTVRGVQNRLASLATKLLGRERSQIESGIEFYNLRVRMVFEALKRGVYSIEDIPELERDLYCWMDSTAAPEATDAA
jgi:DNA-binding NarL/FixJ family response regulator